ncbi:MAG: hypothetical protein J5663_09735 [Bacteroidaceae bacterium]|nr:hypothetical protein [Bacteroidaceae bacterium]
MKQKSIFFRGIIFTLLLVVVSSCKDKDDSPGLTADLFGENILVTTRINMDADTRVGIQNADDNVRLMWQNGDSITLYTKNAKYSYFASIQHDGTTVVFTAYANSQKLTGVEGEQVYAVLNNGATNIEVKNNHLVADSIGYNVLENTSSSARDIMMYSVGTIHDGKLELNFKHMFAYLKIMVNKDKLKNEYLGLVSHTTTIFPTSFEYDMDNDKFTDETLDKGVQLVCVEKDKMEREGNYYVTYVPVFPTEGDVTYFLYDAKAIETEDGEKVEGNAFLLVDDPEDGLKAGQTFKIHSEESIVKSKDKSLDKHIVMLEQATEGPGIKLVFVGQGFTDQDIMSGKYNQAMTREMERFFSVEPYKSFRNRFTSYCVYRVSDSNDLTYIANMPTDSIYSESDKARKYTPVFNENDTIFRTIVVYNAHFVYRSVTNITENGSFVSHIMMNDPYVVCHEAGGHGIALLADEYVEFEGGPTDDDKAYIDAYHKQGIYVNVDYNKEHPIWEKFIHNEDYASEGIGAYEGANCYSTGYYRPTRNSIMRDHYLSHTFNAPSREAIYKAIMKFSGGTYKEADFYKYDRINIASSASETRQGISTANKHGKIHVKGLPPMIMKK